MLIALVWCAMVSISRIYLGVHSFADIYMGLAVGLMLLVPILPLAEHSDFWLLSSPYAPFVLTAIELLGLYYYPGSDRWTPARCVGGKSRIRITTNNYRVNFVLLAWVELVTLHY